MPVILTSCAWTGASIPTGVHSEWIELSSLPKIPIPVQCPACGRLHHWTRSTAWIAGEAPVRVAAE
jgi:hypothetical protein